ncbi:MAG: hypothetical protein U0V75_02085 [Ferruginibacter sp.]
MENRNDILNELKAISPLLAGLEKRNLFTVPEGYFEGLADGMLQQAKVQETGLLGSIGRQQPGAVPGGYFDNLAATIMGRIKAQEEVEEFTVLAGISKKNVYTVPQGYFDNLAAAILDKVQPPQARVLHMGKRNSWFKYAAAAVFTGMVALGVYKFTGSSASLDAVTKEGLSIARQHIFEQEFSKVADEDIIKYLQNNGADVDAAVVANVMDEKELPAQEDYITDDKALDKYLDNIDLTDLKN